MSTQHSYAVCRMRAACLAAAIAVGCDDTDGPGEPILMDAALTDSGVDAGSRDGSTMDSALDASVVDASRTEVSTACYSPLQTPDGGLREALSARGCACIPRPSTSYCVNHLAVVCEKGQDKWGFAVDGYCAPTRRPDPAGSCQELGGASIAPGTTCPSGFATRTGYGRYTSADAGVGEYDDCCYPIEVPAQNCTQAALTVLPAGTQISLLATKCSNAGALRAFVVGQPAASLCCTGP
jgi:hypothetical protein